MTESERDLLMPFLRHLINTRTTPADAAARNLIHAAVKKQPNAHYLLVQRALALECELSGLKHRLLQWEGQAPALDPVPTAADFLNPQTAGWGELQDRNPGVTSSKRLYDFFKQAHSPQDMDLESRAVSFIGEHSGRIWLFILALAAAVVAFKERGL